MNNPINLFDEQEMKSLIKSLLNEKERYQQEKIAQKIGFMKDERTAQFVAGFFAQQQHKEAEDNPYDLIQKLDEIPDKIVNEIIKCVEPRFVEMDLS